MLRQAQHGGVRPRACSCSGEDCPGPPLRPGPRWNHRGRLCNHSCLGHTVERWAKTCAGGAQAKVEVDRQTDQPPTPGDSLVSVLERLREAGYFHVPSKVSIWESWEFSEGETRSLSARGQPRLTPVAGEWRSAWGPASDSLGVDPNSTCCMT